ncbi:2Fe-2S ferredoxin-type domain-containing protein [Hygrophoropsis aurantiaca]|uniref:2Fe-2S ferredoxin-type domain-containing protein n=1 Tax=Hygrophoropsis aurantiaca TaxID=72124 RepID=A0ACB8ACM2_9AGAM|nr:2Fe-2S ferredoxin-type domain-containing protein [Hygrophoropsis aurantiaca]
MSPITTSARIISPGFARTLSSARTLTPRRHSHSHPSARALSSSPHSSQCSRSLLRNLHSNPWLPVHARERNASSSLHTVMRRGFHCSPACFHGDITRPEPGTGIKVHFKDSKGNLIKTIEGNEGDDLLSLAHEYDIDLEGACEGSIACSTCHVILDPSTYDVLPEPSDDENDMLDMAFGLTDTSRLGCQVELTREMDGMEATLPSATRNMFVDGKKPTHH